MKLRIKFAKYGVMKFIGHLDMMRYFQKAIRRSGIDIAYSSGYSPHQIMSFAAPLGVGLQSQGEYLDIEVNSITNSKDMQAKLNAVMVEGIDIISIRLLPEDVKNAMASVAAAKYFITFRKGKEPDFSLEHAVSKCMEKPFIKIIKQTKKSEIELDLKPFIYELSWENNGLSMLVDASSSGNIKPTLVLEALYKDNNSTLGDFDVEITRIETYGNIGADTEKNLIPLEDYGKDFE